MVGLSRLLAVVLLGVGGTALTLLTFTEHDADGEAASCAERQPAAN